MNLYIGEIFKESSNLNNAAEEAISLITFFSQSKVWLEQLQNEQAAIYKVHIALVIPATTRWNLYYYCFASLLKIKGTLRNLVTKINEKIISDAKWILYYYCAWFKEEPTVLLAELEKYKSKKYPYTDFISNFIRTIVFNNGMVSLKIGKLIKDGKSVKFSSDSCKTSDNIEFARLENDDGIFISDNEGSDTDSETNEYNNESINNIYTQPLAYANEWSKTVIDWIEMIENELQDQDNELASIITDIYNISIENIEQIQHPAIDSQIK
ncbi:hypothetical protein C1646_768895 [Rhizophagus diaphanus]|nr:hypothetical protein C1646_768895 [Rhizophagus diaphanus] [Rhizophagus sp. MUCL 43196]